MVQWAGDYIGYLCPSCRAVDETARQLYHAADCEHAGDHGRRYYGKDEFVDTGTGFPEFETDNPAYPIKYDHTEGRGGLCDGEVLGFECTYGISDESPFGIIHAKTWPACSS